MNVRTAQKTDGRAAVYPAKGRRLSLEQRQRQHEKNAEAAQKKIESVLKHHGLSLVANYVKEQNMVHLELIPLELLAARSAAMGAVEEQKRLLTEQGDAIGGEKE